MWARWGEADYVFTHAWECRKIFFDRFKKFFRVPARVNTYTTSRLCVNYLCIFLLIAVDKLEFYLYVFLIYCTIATGKRIFLQGLWWRNEQTTARSHSFEDYQLISMYISLSISYTLSIIYLNISKAVALNTLVSVVELCLLLTNQFTGAWTHYTDTV